MNNWKIPAELHYPLALIAGCFLIALVGAFIVLTEADGPTESPFCAVGRAAVLAKESTLDAAASAAVSWEARKDSLRMIQE